MVGGGWERGGREAAFSQHFPVAFVFTRLNVSSLRFELFLFCPFLHGERESTC